MATPLTPLSRGNASDAPSTWQAAWVAPSWMEYQTDSDDSDATASRKKELKARKIATSAIYLGDELSVISAIYLGDLSRRFTE